MNQQNNNPAPLLIILLVIFGAIIFAVFNKPQKEIANGPSLEPIPFETKEATSVDLKTSVTPTIKNAPKAILETTAGKIVIELNTGLTPITVANFVNLINKSFYDNTVFHRVVSGFMIQGGDPTGTGTGGPGYKFDDEIFEGEYVRGTVAMANSGPNTNGSQFFIMQKDAITMPKNYVIFGKVIEGMEVVDAIASAPVGLSESGEMSKPVNPVSIQSATIMPNQ